MYFLNFESLFFMPRKLRVEYEGAIYHLMSRGDRREGWCWGPKGFREELLEMIAARQGPQHHGPELKESDAQKAERLVKEKLRKLGWTDKELKERRKGDRQKARLAAQLRKETTMNWAWITTRLAMGHWRTAANAARAHSAK
jgi:hypothetical protein